MEKYKKALTIKYSEERDSMTKTFGEIKIELFKKIAESEITIKKLRKQISDKQTNEKGNCLINQQQLQLQSTNEVVLVNTTEGESQNENVSLQLLNNVQVEFNIEKFIFKLKDNRPTLDQKAEDFRSKHGILIFF